MWMIHASCFASVFLLIYAMLQVRLQKLEDEDRAMKLGNVILLKICKPFIQVLAYFLQKVREDPINRKYAKKLLISGNRFHFLPVEFVALKWLSSLVGVAVGLFLVTAIQTSYMAVAIFAFLAYFYPDLWLRETTAKRKRSIFKDLPFCMDLMTLSVEAGASFRGAIEKVVEKGSKGPLRDELEKMLQDLRLGLVRSDALQALAERTDLYVIRSFTSALIHADKLGTPIGRALRIQSDLRRTERFQKLEKMAQQAPVKMLMPLLFFILPSVFIIILGPIALKFVAEGL
jgi:tight adherence protein C